MTHRMSGGSCGVALSGACQLQEWPEDSTAQHSTAQHSKGATKGVGQNLGQICDRRQNTALCEGHDRLGTSWIVALWAAQMLVILHLAKGQ
jgi:hypothetical protein